MSAKRIIHPELFDLTIHRLKFNGEAQINMQEKKDPRRLLVLASPLYVGTLEKTGNNDGKLIELFQKTIGGANREPYCLAGVQSMIAFVEKIYGIVSPIYPTEHCMTCWRETPQTQRVSFSPNPGALGIYRHAGTDSGHAILFIEQVMETVYGVKRKFSHNVEWNTTSGVDSDGQIVREGGGVYWTKRPWQTNVGSMKFVGHLRPF